jgi:hypothetical protein
MSGQFHVPTALLPGKEPQVPIGDLVGPEPIWRIHGAENSCACGASTSDPSVVLHLASCYTDCNNPMEIIVYFDNQMVEQRD